MANNRSEAQKISGRKFDAFFELARVILQAVTSVTLISPI
jgi:hypothetical protein